MTDQDIYLTYSEYYRMLDDNLDELTKRAENYSQTSQIIKAWEEANLRYLQARKILFAKYEDTIKELVNDFRQAVVSTRTALEELKKGILAIGEVIDVISDCVDKGKQLADIVEDLNKGKGQPITILKAQIPEIKPKVVSKRKRQVKKFMKKR